MVRIYLRQSGSIFSSLVASVDLLEADGMVVDQARCTEPRGGRTPDEQLTESLGKISVEIDSVTRQLAAGAIDNLAIQTRYLDYKYGAALDEGEKTP